MAHAVGGFLLTVARQWMTNIYIVIYIYIILYIYIRERERESLNCLSNHQLCAKLNIVSICKNQYTLYKLNLLDCGLILLDNIKAACL